jgi:dihydrofolate reductase
MLVSIIAAMDRRGLIGDGTGLPWHLPADLRRFRKCTWGKPIIMGRTTFQTIGTPLPGRLNIVLSHNPLYSPPGCRVARAFHEALAIAEDHLTQTGGDEVMIIGGAGVYAEASHRCDRLYLTLVEGSFSGTTYFPLRELLTFSWRPVCEPAVFPPDEKNPYPHSFHILERTREAEGASVNKLQSGSDRVIETLRQAIDSQAPASAGKMETSGQTGGVVTEIASGRGSGSANRGSEGQTGFPG